MEASPGVTSSDDENEDKLDVETAAKHDTTISTQLHRVWCKNPVQRMEKRSLRKVTVMGTVIQ